MPSSKCCAISDFLKLFGKEIEALDGTFVKALNSKGANYTEGRLNQLDAWIDAAMASAVTFNLNLLQWLG